MDKNFYEILGISKNATQEEVKKAYRIKIKEYHPDKFQNEIEKEKATKVIQLINHIYTILSNPREREEYDKYLKQNEPLKQSFNNTKQENNNKKYTYKNSKNENNNINQFFSKIIRSFGGLAVSFIIIILANIALETYQKNFAYKEEKAQLKILEVELTNLETFLNSKKIMFEDTSNKLEDTKKIIKEYEEKIKYLEKQYKIKPSKEILYKYNKIFDLYENSLRQYNLNIKILKEEYDNYNNQLEIYNKKIDDYNQIAVKIKYYKIVPKGVRIR
ncbi:DnaJ domain-containing protein [Cetobacterium sp.]|uniref:J domain-containing protein n=1 Tax=Cetobacterium sp. TaxID=2071632 RepID=UPI0025C1AA73|nr:DnaJ domain-containing protein [Cetobacterium sp.]